MRNFVNWIFSIFNWFLTMKFIGWINQLAHFVVLHAFFARIYNETRKLNSSIESTKRNMHLWIFSLSTFCPFLFMNTFVGTLRKYKKIRRRWKQKEKLRIIKLTASECIVRAIAERIELDEEGMSRKWWNVWNKNY